MEKVYSMSDHTFYLTTHDGKTIAFRGGDDDYIKISFDNNAVTSQESPNGNVQWHKRITKKGTIVFSVQWGSVENEYLNQIKHDQDQGGYIMSTAFKRITESENTSLFSTGRGFIQKTADASYGAEGGPRVWTFEVEEMMAEERTDIPG